MTLGRAREGKWTVTVEDQLTPIVALIDPTEARRAAVRGEAAPLEAAIGAACA